MRRSWFPSACVVVAVLFCYLPLVALVLNSFNASRFGTTWRGWSLDWYRLLFSDRSSDIWEALQRTLVIASVASLAAMLFGTLAALAIHRYRSGLQRVHLGLVYLPTVVPDILIGISLLLVFVAAGLQLSMVTIVLAHVTFCISYVALVVLGRLQDFDDSVIDAARDLGAGWVQTFVRVVFPMLAPGIVAGGLLAFTLSVDDFVITFFTAGPGNTTLPVKIYSMTKHTKEMPVINALSTLMIVVTFVSAWTAFRLGREICCLTAWSIGQKLRGRFEDLRDLPSTFLPE